MPACSIRSSLRLCALMAMLFPLTGCIVDFDQHESRGVSLSQAMRTSAGGGGEISGHSSGESGPDIDFDSDEGVAIGGDGGVGVSYDNREYEWQVPLDVGYEVPLNGDIQALTRFTLTPIAAETEHHFVGLFVAGDIVNLKPGTLPASAVKNTWMLESGLSYRYYFTPAHTFFSPYISASAAYQLLSWDYRNPVIVNGDTIGWDNLTGLGGYAGLGIAIKRNSHLSLFGEAGFGGTVFVGETGQGFDNDVFGNFGYFTVKAGLSLKF